MRKKICVLTGAGISAESGLKTFRDSGGLWENYNVYDVATPEAWNRNKELVNEFYNKRRKQLESVKPNEGHRQIRRLESSFETVVITQNVDDLHERAGRPSVIHLHGELLKVRSELDPSLIYECKGELSLEDRCEKGGSLRPHVVWFGEMVPMLEVAIEEMLHAAYVLIIGTSMQVYPAASLTAYAPEHAKIIYVDPNPQINFELQRQFDRLKVFKGPATVKVKEAVEYILTASE